MSLFLVLAVNSTQLRSYTLLLKLPVLCALALTKYGLFFIFKIYCQNAEPQILLQLNLFLVHLHSVFSLEKHLQTRGCSEIGPQNVL